MDSNPAKQTNTKVCTPIYYVNGEPHIGHMYDTSFISPLQIQHNSGRRHGSLGECEREPLLSDHRNGRTRTEGPKGGGEEENGCEELLR